jgi:1,4-alpha-glucan branching enzyme
VELPEICTPLEQEYFKQMGSTDYQFDLDRESVLTYFLGSIAHYIKYYGIGGIHFTKVHKICQERNGGLLVKLANLLCERLREDCITLASSKEFIAGLTWPILEGGLGFSFTYNFHESLSLSQQHESIYEMVKQIQSSSNCLSLNFKDVQPTEHIYLLFTFLISRKGVFTRGPIGGIREDLKKVLKLRRQE